MHQGAARGVRGCQGCIGAGRECSYSGARRNIGDIRENLGTPRGVGGIWGH